MSKGGRRKEKKNEARKSGNIFKRNKARIFFKVRLLTVCEHRTFLLRIYKDCFRFTLVEKL